MTFKNFALFSFFILEEKEEILYQFVNKNNERKNEFINFENQIIDTTNFPSNRKIFIFAMRGQLYLFRIIQYNKDAC